ncbi:MAG: thioredoxin family protein [Opitutales bacterium]|nr:thioredoxin family protein [Opitutales bacterium]
MIKKLFPFSFFGIFLFSLFANAQDFSSLTVDSLISSAPAAQNVGSKVSAQLTRDASGEYKIIVRLDQKPDWHVYWKNPGELGYPLSIDWKGVSAGVRFGEWRWSVPEYELANGITSFIYGARGYIEIPVVFEQDCTVRGNASWLACDSGGCKPCDSEIAVELKKDVPATESIVPADAFPQKNHTVKAESFRNNEQLLLVAFSGLARGEHARTFFPFGEGVGTQVTFTVADTEAGTVSYLVGAEAHVLEISGVLVTDRGAYEIVTVAKDVPATVGTPAVDVPVKQVPANAAALTWRHWTPEAQEEALDDGKIVYIDFTATWCATCQVNKRVYSDKDLEKLLSADDIVLFKADWTRHDPAIAAELALYNRSAVPFNVFKKADAPDVVLPSLFSGPQVVADGLAAVRAGTVLEIEEEEGDFGLMALALAFVGGLILNLMPCVFPVLGLKIMHFANNAGQNRRQVMAHGLVFASGVLLSFWALAGLLIALRAGGEQLGWGFQMQSPVFVLCMVVLLFVFGLSLSGVFEFGTSATGVGGNLMHKSGFAGTFFSGVLAVIVATPCSAPFLAQALGTALTLPPVESLALFTSIALGLAFPYLFLSAFPQWLKFLPKPGAWMETFKQVMAFLLYAPALYFVWVLISQIEKPLAELCVLISFSVIAFACWLYGRYVTPINSPKTRWIAGIFAFVIFAGTLIADICWVLE